MARWLKTSLRILALSSMVAAAAPLLAACGGGSGSSNASGSGTIVVASHGTVAAPTKGPIVEVQISDNQFTPAEITIKVGTTVRWVWSGNNMHSVLLNGVDSGKHQGSGTFEQTFSDAAGTYNYQCGVHGAAMAGKIIVQ